jgi:hypothetical protein
VACLYNEVSVLDDDQVPVSLFQGDGLAVQVVYGECYLYSVAGAMDEGNRQQAIYSVVMWIRDCFE